MYPMNQNAKDDLVLIPGLGDDALLWQHQVRHLADIATLRVADVSKSESIAALATEFLDTAPPRFSLCGFSLGGYVALHIHRKAPERVRRLALIGTNARADTEARKAKRIALLGKLREPDGFRRVLGSQLKELVAPESLDNEALRNTIIDMGLRVGPEVFARQNRACMGRSSSLEHLGNIKCPTLVMCGRQDAAAPIEMSAQIAEGIPGSRFIVVEDAGHYVQLERPQAVTALLRHWLQYS